jgi:hypothetical protein
MTQTQLDIRGFKTTFTVIGVIYVWMASWALVRGVSMMHDFGVPETVTAEPVVQDLFSFFYQLMATVGLLIVLFGHVTRGRRAQSLVAAAFCVLNVSLAWRDLITSDSSFGNHLYRGEKTLVFVYISLTLVLIFGALAIIGLRAPQPQGVSVSS